MRLRTGPGGARLQTFGGSSAELVRLVRCELLDLDLLERGASFLVGGSVLEVSRGHADGGNLDILLVGKSLAGILRVAPTKAAMKAIAVIVDAGTSAFDCAYKILTCPTDFTPGREEIEPAGRPSRAWRMILIDSRNSTIRTR